MKKLVLAFGILAGVVSVSMGAISDEEWNRAKYNCIVNKDKNACQALINNGFVSVEQCYIDKSEGDCGFVAGIYYLAERYREAIPYFEKAIALGDYEYSFLLALAAAYDKLQDYYNAKKYYEIACNKGNGDAAQAESCFRLGIMYDNGQGVRQDYHRAYEPYKKACDMKNAPACNNLGVLYDRGQGVRQNLSTAKQYYGKACDLGGQVGCDNYKLLNSQGVR